MTLVRDLPWLQPTADENPEVIWGATYRDVWILDAENNAVGEPYNLTTHDLSSLINRTTLKSRIRAAARAVDADGDGLRDDWERILTGATDVLDSSSADDDGDGADNWTEFACGTDPLDAASIPALQFLQWPQSGVLYPAVEATLRADAGIRYVVEFGENLDSWNEVGVVPIDAIDLFYDGTGLGRQWFRWSEPFGTGPGFFRLRAERVDP